MIALQQMKCNEETKIESLQGNELMKPVKQLKKIIWKKVV